MAVRRHDPAAPRGELAQPLLLKLANGLRAAPSSTDTQREQGPAVGSKAPGKTLEEIFRNRQTSAAGLSVEEAVRRLLQYGPNRLRDDNGNHPMAVLFRQFRSPMVFILLAAAALLVPFHASAATFKTAWFVESLLTELAVVAVMRTHKSFFRSLPSPLLIGTSTAIAVLTLAVPYLPFVDLVGLVPLSLPLTATIVAIVVAYVVASELLKGQINLLGLSPRPPGATTRGPLSVPR